MKEMKRVLALVLCLVMLVGILPVSAMAKPGGPSGPGSSATEGTAPTQPDDFGRAVRPAFDKDLFQHRTQGNRGFLLKSGRRFSRKARPPS